MNLRNKYFFIFLFYCIIIYFITPRLEAKNPDITAEVLENVVAGIDTERNIIDFDNILNVMSTGSQNSKTNPANGFNFDAIYRSMDSGDEDLNLIASVAESISIDKTLDFIFNAYSYPVNSPSLYNSSLSNSNFPALAGTATLPVYGIITSKFGYRPAYKRMHKGVDIKLNIGDTVRCAVSGTVQRVDWDPKGYGLFVVVKHSNNLETRYAHLSKSLVIPGMTLAAGSPLALGGNTGNSTGPHLHFETRFEGQAVDPTSMFDFNTHNFSPDNLIRPTSILDNSSILDTYGVNSVRENQAPQATKNTYVVRAGDTVAGISAITGISVLNLCRMNMISSTEKLDPGRMLRLR